MSLNAAEPPQPETGPGAATKVHKLKVSDKEAAKRILAAGGRLIADYGEYQLFRVDATLVREFAGNARAEDVTEQNVIKLNAASLDTTTPEVKALRKPVPPGNSRRLHLVQFAGPVKPEWKAELEQTGVEVVTYVANNAYLLYAHGTSLAQMQAWARSADYVQWEGPYRDEHKIHPRARLSDAKGNPKTPTTDLFAIQMVADTDANALSLQVIDRLKLEPVKRQTRVLNYLNVVVRLPPARLQEVAAQPEVVSITPYDERKKFDERQNVIMISNLSGNGPAGPGYLSWLAGKGFTQAQFVNSGFAVDVTDSGIDNGTITPGHFGLYEFGATNQPSRYIYSRLEGTANLGSTRLGCDGHGNLNAHVVAGYNDRPAGFPHTDSFGFHYGLGVCPFVKVGSSVIFDPDKFTFPDYEDLQSRAYNDGARVSNNSWGTDNEGDYDIDSQAYDVLVRDAQPVGAAFPAAGNQEMVILFASGNAGPSSQTVGSPGTAKNVITVGAAENVHSHSSVNGGNNVFGDDGCFLSDSGADNANDLASFSSRGPCSDGRRKPEIVAPGTHITGGVGQISPPPPVTGNGSALGCFQASGVCALLNSGGTGNPNNFFPLGQQFYTTSTGTSHSSPAAAGAAALLRQYFLNLGSNAPSPAMTKAFLVNSARYLSGNNAGDSLWSHNQGMGEVNLGLAFDGAARSVHDQLTADKFTGSGQTRTFTGAIVDSSKPFRVTVAWTDAPGNTIGAALHNNLDLTVTVGGNTYKGNVFAGAFSTSGGATDSLNNMESVFLPPGLSGSFEIVVSGANINSDGVPNEAPAVDQDFALVIYNGIETTSPVIVADNTTVQLESCNPTNNAVDPGETVVVNFALHNTGTANTANLVATLQATGGVTSVSGPQNYGALLAGGPSVVRSFTFTPTGECGAVISAELQLQDGTNLGPVTFKIPLGKVTPLYSQNFDGVGAPSLPAGWTTTSAGSQGAWVTSSVQSDTPPNAAYSANSQGAGENELVSPQIVLTSSTPQLSFRQSFVMESGFDGGLLEIKIAGGSFVDIIAAGGSFIAGGYTHTLSTSFGNPLGGRMAWSGNSGGFITTTVQLPPSAAGQNIQLRWRCGTDQAHAGLGWFIDNVVIDGRVCCGGGGTVTPPFIEAVSASLQSESCAPNNSAPDPGEMVTFSFSLRNVGVGNAANVTATLLTTNGVSSPSAPQNYGALTPGGAVVSRSFTFTSSGSCGTTVSPTFQLVDGAQNIGLVTFNLQLGQFSPVYSENFDSVSPPALPGGWTSTPGGAQVAWTSTTAVKDSSPNALFSPSAATAGTNQLITPAIILPATPVQLTFRNNFNMEASPSGGTAYDGGVLEIKIGAGSFVDIFTAGGSFIAGGYSHVLSSGYGNPLAGRRCWSGNSAGFLTTSIVLPPAASGQSVQLRWRSASDNSVAGTGWYIDTISMTARTCCGEVIAPVASFTGTPLSGGKPLNVVFNDTSSGTITNHSWNFGNGLTLNTMSTSVSVNYTNVGTNTVSLTVYGPLGTNKLTRTNYVVVTNAVALLVSNSLALAAESCTNGVVDPGETVTMSFGLSNLGTANTTNLVGTLQASGGIISPSGPQAYGVVPAGGAPVVRSFSFIPTGPCGGTNVATIQLQDGLTNYGTLSFAFILGQLGSVVSTQSFDGISGPALPAGWSTTTSGAGFAWVTTNFPSDSPPNSVYSRSAGNPGLASLVSPVISFPVGGGQLSFRHNYQMEDLSDGGMLEIKIGSGAFTNIVYAGGIFVSNGYTGVLYTNYDNPIGGQPAWTGNSAGAFINSVVNLPTAVSGQDIQFRWSCGSDSSVAYAGWYVDTVRLTGFQCCASPPAITSQPQNQTLLAGDTATFTVAANGALPLSYQWRFNGTNLANATTTLFSRVNVQVPDIGNYSVVVTNVSGSVTSSSATLRIVNRPVLLNPKRTNNSFQFTINGNGGYNYLVEGSTNLATWSSVGTVSNASGQVQFTDPGGSNLLYRYYRARLLP